MPRDLAFRFARAPGLCALVAALAAASAASAQEILQPFSPNGETTQISGPYARYQRRVLKLSAHRYAVLFEPGYVDAETARRAIEPLCRTQGRSASVVSTVAPADLVVIEGVADILQGIRVDCL